MNVAVVGVGLIGGSIALARATASGRTCASPTRRAAGVAEALDGADVAFVAAPLGVLGDVIDEVLAAAPADCVVSDVGSVKASLLRDDERSAAATRSPGPSSAGASMRAPTCSTGRPGT